MADEIEEIKAVETAAGDRAVPIGGHAAAGSSKASPGGRRRLIRSRLDLLAVAPAVLVGLAALTWVLPPRSGPAAFFPIFEPYLFIVAGVVLAPVAVLGRARLLSASLVVGLLAGGPLFGSEWVSLPGSAADRHDLSVLSWNVQYGMRTPAEQAVELEDVTVDVVGLLELEPDAAEAIENDPIIDARYPYRAMEPRESAWGVGVMSRYPISKVVSVDFPATLDFLVSTPRGTVHVILAHPRPAEIATISPLRLPINFDPSARDGAIAEIRTRIDAALAAGDRLLVVGDFNTSPLEAEYAALTAGLRDTHVQVGQGPGWTWRPSRLTFLPLAFLRIDLQLSGGAIYPASTWVDCSLPGDHCRLFGDYEID